MCVCGRGVIFWAVEITAFKCKTFHGHDGHHGHPAFVSKKQSYKRRDVIVSVIVNQQRAYDDTERARLRLASQPTAKVRLGRGRREGCGLQLGGWGRSALAPLRSCAACWPGGHRGMAVWPFQGSKGPLLAALCLWCASSSVLSA